MAASTTYDVQGLINPDWPDHHVNSLYADSFWLPRIGPSAMCLLRWISHQPDHQANASLPDLSEACLLYTSDAADE